MRFMDMLWLGCDIKLIVIYAREFEFYCKCIVVAGKD